MMQDLTRAKQFFAAVAGWMALQVDPLANTQHPQEWDAWCKELSAVREQLYGSECIRIALVGTTGAGKSSFLNAVLGQQLLPVGVMEPCTAFVTVVRYHRYGGYEMAVDFISEAEWRSDLDTLQYFLAAGEDKHHPEARKAIQVLKKRIQAVFGAAWSEHLTPADIASLPLPAEVAAIFAAQSRQVSSFGYSHEMLAQLKTLIHGKSLLWPLVKQVTISGPYACLQGGLELVDLPGLNDPNEARVEVTRGFLRSSPFVWVMFPMVRGLTNDIQMILHEEKLLRTLVLSGSYAALSLIGTKADDVDANVAEQLGLEPDSSLSEIIQQYRQQTTIKAREQLVGMVRDLGNATDQGETLDRLIDMAHHIEVYATSANAYCRLEGIGSLLKDYGIDRIEDTGIPAIHALLQHIGQDFGTAFYVNIAIQRLTQLCDEITFFFRTKTQKSSPEIDQVRELVEQETAAFSSSMDAAEQQARLQLEYYREQFLERIEPLLSASIHEVERTCQGWRNLQWITLRAIMARNGLFKSTTSGQTYDFNGDLAEPLLRQLPVSWEKYFSNDLRRVQDEFINHTKTTSLLLSSQVRLAVKLVFRKDSEPLRQQFTALQDRVSVLSQLTNSQLQQAIADQRRALANSIPQTAKQYMLPAYEMAKQESGDGAKGRVLGLLEPKALEVTPLIYANIQHDLIEGLHSLEAMFRRLFGQLAQAAKDHAQHLAHNTAIDIDEAANDPAVLALLASTPQMPNPVL
jgi:hypothetical protein